MFSNVRIALPLFLLAFAAFSFTTISQDIAHRWEMLGSKKVNYGLDRDEIMVTAQEGVFTALKLKVKRSPINMHKIAVHYGNGEVDNIDIRQEFRAGGESRVIDLAGNKRVIQKVVFWYDTKNFANRKGLIELWGRH